MARERRKISVGEIVRTAISLSAADPDELSISSRLIEKVVDPTVKKAGETFLSNLDAVTVDDLCNDAMSAHILEEEKASGDFAI